MTPGVLPLTLYRGDSYHWRFVLWGDADKTVPINLTNATPKAEIRTAAGGTLITQMVLTVTLPNTIVATLPAASCALLPATGGAWDLQLTYTTSGDVQTVLAGAVKVTMDVTDSATALAGRQVVRLAG
jgi:hypothetical protein